MNVQIEEIFREATNGKSFPMGVDNIHGNELMRFAELVWKDGYKAGMNAMIQSQMNNPEFIKAMDVYYENKWAHRFD